MPFSLINSQPEDQQQPQDPQQPSGGYKLVKSQPEEEPSFYDRIGGARGIAATGVRMLAGVLGAEGGVSGAGINSLGETIAEGVEGSDLSPARIATEGAIGAVPFGEIIKGGKVLTSALRSGLYGAVGTGARELASGQSLDPSAIATQGAIGAASGGLLSKFFGLPHTAAPAEAAKGPEYVFEPTARTGPGTGVLAPGPKGGKPRYTPTEVPRSTPIDIGDVSGLSPESVQSHAYEGTMAPPAPPMEPQDFKSGIDPTTNQPYQDPYAVAPKRVQRVMSQEIADAAKQAKADALAEKQRIAMQQIEAAKEGKVPKVGNPRESYSAPIPGGTESVSVSYKTPGDESDILSLSPEESAAAARLQGGSQTSTVPASNRPPGAPPAGTPVGDIYDAWRAKGRDHRTALRLASKMRPPLSPNLPTAPEVPTAGVPASVGATENIPSIQTQPVAPTSPEVMQQPSPLANALTPKEARAASYQDLLKRLQTETPSPEPQRAAVSAEASDVLQPAVSTAPPEPAPTPASSISPLNPPEGVTPESIAAAKAARNAELDAHGAMIAKDVDQAIADKARSGFQAIPGGKFGAPPDVNIPPETEASALTKFFKTPVDVVGQAYRDAKAASDINPLAKQQLGVSLQQEASKAGLPTRGTVAPDALSKFLETKVSPEISATSSKVTPTEIAPPVVPETPPTQAADVVPPDYKTGGDWVDEELKNIKQLNDDGLPPKSVGAAAAGDPNIGPAWYKLPADAKAAVLAKHPDLASKLGFGALGAALGAPLGSTMEPDDPTYGAFKGAIGGALAGFAGRSGYLEAMEKGAPGSVGAVKELLNWRNSGLLSGLAQIKKPLSDIGAYIGLIGEKAMSGDTATAAALGREILNVHALAKDYIEGWKNPEIARQVLGETNLAREETPTGALGWVTKPFAAAQNLTSKAMQRAGVPASEATEAMMLGDPKTELGRKWLGLQNTPGMGGQVVRAIRPFARIATNIAERGLERTPGIGAFMGDPATSFARQATGGLAMLGGLATGESDASNAAAGDPTSNAVKGLRRAAMASYGLPFAIGEAVGGQSAQEIYNLIPGLRSNMEPPAPGDTVFTWVRKLAAAGLDQFIPAIIDQANKATGAAR